MVGKGTNGGGSSFLCDQDHSTKPYRGKRILTSTRTLALSNRNKLIVLNAHTLDEPLLTQSLSQSAIIYT